MDGSLSEIYFSGVSAISKIANIRTDGKRRRGSRINQPARPPFDSIEVLL
jgi:hypothetical protein